MEILNQLSHTHTHTHTHTHIHTHTHTHTIDTKFHQYSTNMYMYEK